MKHYGSTKPIGYLALILLAGCMVACETAVPVQSAVNATPASPVAEKRTSPYEEEKMRTQQARELAVKHADTAKLAVNEGRGREALDHYIKALRAAPAEDASLLKELRMAAMTVALGLYPRPAIPPEAISQGLRAEERLRITNNQDGFNKVANDYEAALRLAPWWADAYFNYALVLEKIDRFTEARDAYELFLMANPRSPDTVAIQRKIITLEIKEEEANSLVGGWRAKAENGHLYGHYTMERKGKLLMLIDPETGHKEFEGVVDGSKLEGYYFHRQRADGCPTTEPTVISADIVSGGKELVFKLVWQGAYFFEGSCKPGLVLEVNKKFIKI